MERKLSSIKFDDTDPLTATIERSLTTQGHTEYVIRVQRGPLVENSWKTKKRYNDFVELNNALQVSNFDLPLPPKKMFGNMEREFIHQRQLGLQNYLNAVLSNHVLASSLLVKKFLDPVNYFQNLNEKSYQQVLMIFRSDPTWNVIESVHDIGWRIRKQYFTIRKHQDPLKDFLLSKCCYGPDFCLSEKELNMILKHLCSIEHSFILSPIFGSSDNTGCVTIYDFNVEGSLKDYIYKCKPRLTYFKKYKKPKSAIPLSVSEVKSFGRQILEALKDLHSRGIPFGHLHSGNVFLVNGACRISSLENIFLGLSPYYRTFAIQLRKVKTLMDLDIYSFGHIMYEMTFGESLTTPTCDQYPEFCEPEIKSVLESILSTEACKGGLPTVEHLLTHPFFKDSLVKGGTKNHFRVTSQVQESIKIVRGKVEKRLQDDQTLIKKVQRLQKVQSVLQEENRLGFKRNQPLLKKVQENNVLATENRSASPIGSTGNESTCNSESSPKKVPAMENRVPVTNGSSLQSKTIENANERSALLSSIQNFSANKLKKAVTNDRSTPMI